VGHEDVARRELYPAGLATRRYDALVNTPKP
jgi:hypothetical protein